MDVDRGARRRIHTEVLEAIGLTPECMDQMVEASIAAYNKGEDSRRFWTFPISRVYRGKFTRGQITEAVEAAIRENSRLSYPYVYGAQLPGRVFNGSISLSTSAKAVD
jgi:hypothetical protein